MKFFIKITFEQHKCNHGFPVAGGPCSRCGLPYDIWRALEHMTFENTPGEMPFQA